MAVRRWVRLLRRVAFWVMVIALLRNHPVVVLCAWVAYVTTRVWEDRHPPPPPPPRRAFSDVPRRTSPDPIPGEKLAFVVVRGERAAFAGIVQPETYGPDEEAACTMEKAARSMSNRQQTLRILVNGQPHGPVPNPSCSCGFYAWKPSRDRELFHRMVPNGMRLTKRKAVKATVTATFRLDVELLGRVIAFERGYRAGHQRVMRAYADQRCVICGRWAVGFGSGGFAVGAPVKHPLVPTCGCQVPWRWSISQVQDLLGTEIRWDPRRKPPLTRRWRRRRVAA